MLGFRRSAVALLTAWLIVIAPPTSAETIQYYSPVSQSAAATCSDAVPAAASSIGYNTETFCTNAFTASNVDTAATGNPGYQWYINNCAGVTPHPAQVTLPGDGTISLKSDGQASPNGHLLSSITCTSGQPCSTCWHGVAFGGGYYIEVSVKYAQSSAGTSGSWPASFQVSLESRTGEDQWPGQATGYQDYEEVDDFEYYQGGNGKANTTWQASAINWYGNPLVEIGKSTTVNLPGGYDFTAFHAYGVQWVPATGTTSGACGSFRYYLDGVLASTATVDWSIYDSSASPPPSGGNACPGVSSMHSIADVQHLFPFLGGANSNPLIVQSFHVFQPSAANNRTH